MKRMNTLGHSVNIKDFRVIIPVLNEEEILKSDKFRQYLKTIPFKVSFVDSNSTDSSLSIIESLGFEYFRYEGSKSIYGAIHFVASYLVEENIVILPADCQVDLTQLKSLSGKAFLWGGFLKKYDQSNLFINMYLFLQNRFRTQAFNNLVWTNVIFCKKSAFLDNGRAEGFLEDVILSDALRRVERPIILNGPCICSFRKYNGLFLKRLYVNLKIMFYFRFKLKTIKELKSIYSR